jgi:hypothetical protein
MRIKNRSFRSSGAIPITRANTTTPSRRAWPAIILGPVAGPLLRLSVMVVVKIGPGIIAPDRAIMKEDTYIVSSPPTSYPSFFSDYSLQKKTAFADHLSKCIRKNPPHQPRTSQFL